MKKYFIDLKINDKIYHLGKLPYETCIDLANELNCNYKFKVRKKIQNEYERQYWIETEIIDVCEIERKKNLFNIQ